MLFNPFPLLITSDVIWVFGPSALLRTCSKHIKTIYWRAQLSKARLTIPVTPDSSAYHARAVATNAATKPSVARKRQMHEIGAQIALAFSLTGWSVRTIHRYEHPSHCEDRLALFFIKSQPPYFAPKRQLVVR